MLKKIGPLLKKIGKRIVRYFKDIYSIAAKRLHHSRGRSSIQSPSFLPLIGQIVHELQFSLWSGAANEKRNHAAPDRLELTTLRLTAECSTD